HYFLIAVIDCYDLQRVHAQPLEQYTTEELYACFCFGRDDIKYIADLVRPKLQHRSQKSHALSVEEHCLIALCFYASGTFNQVVGDNMEVEKSTISNVVKAVSVALDDQMAQTTCSFYLLGIMPNTNGVIDCTRMHIQAPQEREEEYVNRTGRHSINIQLVGNWPGSVHDARVLRESALYRELQSDQPNGIILGDISYPLLPWLMTHFPVANTPKQARCNSTHCKRRCEIELLNGLLKRRFACLNYLRVEPACHIILACIVLHDIATRHNVPLDDIYDGLELDEEQPEQPPMFFPNEGQSGHLVRDAIVRHYF
uniref:DDE Tnp4 domain-containing protein n=1 Tax=Paramormyrops kingsleyae TaxID=1676925 RepID=A0A3B3SW79_9TELE